ncbi:haloacid dehalogenase superfamily, subfamily IA, variant 3 with third motif having DD or ED [Rubellimicrobium thermophilum DSM 16684]|uniref:Haloacid dehalogenase superfamily, subfamily IA, variant 3 with third motif having DD or ED n=1 Tax=Rubellimicrobium thermophilum DSM 16684 TaxID=1123069 RepID=S9SDA3_9RHOB|nr:HAD family phosphatase [Rubellimicrobium thermophilum]EPX84204.1 haloacid dehalogenase superfamily, subfamily IA, variant 3 with third motif having DD or ED [Rubellimicrobium thermophilum DSM 16684]
MTSRYDAVVFDLDGTLIDTESLCNAAGVEACAALGLPVSGEFFESLAGIDDRTRVQLIGEHVGTAVDLSAFLAAWDRLCIERFAQGIPLKPGAIELLEQIAAAGIPLALATSSRRGPAEDKLRMAGLARHFRTVVTFDDVAAPKPAPDAYLLAVDRLGVPPARALAFEDSETGARAAHAAGLTVVQVPDLHPTQGAHAHHVASSLLEGAAMAGLLPV